MNTLFANALKKTPQATPPIWFMRQAGRYHQHYQKLRAKHDFDQLCREPELAAQVALGPVEEFDFDVAILFSDLLYPLDAVGMGLSYTDSGPKLEKSLSSGFTLPVNFARLESYLHECVTKLEFQGQAVRLTREQLASDKSLIGFVGGFWTLFTYASESAHAGSLIWAKTHFEQSELFITALKGLLKKNIKLQLDAGAEVVMIFDTAAGEVSPDFFKKYLAPGLIELAQAFPQRLGYYSKGTQSSFFSLEFFGAPWAGIGIDHRWDLPLSLRLTHPGFLQGNFDQALLFLDSEKFETALREFLQPIKKLSLAERAGWVCGLGHGVLPKTPERNVKRFVEIVRKELA